jgi:hypothetical protein
MAAQPLRRPAAALVAKMFGQLQARVGDQVDSLITPDHSAS